MSRTRKMMKNSQIKKQMVVIDTFCLLHMISDEVTRKEIPADKQVSYINSQLIFTASCDWLGELKTEGAFPVFSVDDKTLPYWRKSLYSPYKDGRSKSPIFDDIKTQCLKILRKLPYPFLSYPTQESDDIIAGLTRIKPADASLVIATIDSDLIGLVDEARDVSWFSLSDRWLPRYRNNIRVINEWALKRHSILLEHPTDLWKFKQDTGDASDNLPPGTPVYMIDLFNPPPEHDILANHTTVEVLRSLYDTTPERHPQVEKATAWLRRHGYPPCIRKYEGN